MVDEPVIETGRETNKVTQEESEETNQSVKEKFQQFSPDNLPALEDNESNQQISDRKLLSQQEKVIKITSQTSNSIDCSRNNYLKQPSDFDEQCASLKVVPVIQPMKYPQVMSHNDYTVKKNRKETKNKLLKVHKHLKKLHQNVT